MRMLLLLQEAIGRVGVAAILQVMRSPQHAFDVDVHKWAAGALHNLCANNTENRAAATADGAVPLLRVRYMTLWGPADNMLRSMNSSLSVQDISLRLPGTRAAYYASIAYEAMEKRLRQQQQQQQQPHGHSHSHGHHEGQGQAAGAAVPVPARQSLGASV